MLEVTIVEGSIYHIKSKRRRKVVFNEELRGKVRKTTKAVLDMIKTERVPEAVLGKHCDQCSLQEVCMPAVKRVSLNLFEPLPEEVCATF